jgi:hypothetical protein
MSPSESGFQQALTDDDVKIRRAAARYCVINGIDAVPAAVLERAPGDNDAAVRERTACAIERAIIPLTQCPSEELVDPLIALRDDSSPRVRAAAALAVIRTGCEGSGEPRSPSVEAISAACELWAHAAYDSSDHVRDRLATYTDAVYGPDEIWFNLPGAFVDQLPGHIAKRDADSDREPIALVDDLLAYPGSWSPEYFEISASKLIVSGWQDGSERARETVRRWVEEDASEREEIVRRIASESDIDIQGDFE